MIVIIIANCIKILFININYSNCNWCINNSVVTIKVGNCTIRSFTACQQLPRDIATSNSKANKYIMSMDHIHYTKSINLAGSIIGIK